MPAMLILAVAVVGLVLVVLAVVVVGIRQEPSAQELTGQAPRLIATLARRLLRGVCPQAGSVRNP
jgi:heme/copper-type cytochrome/quinol oxidase subunit 2